MTLFVVVGAGAGIVGLIVGLANAIYNRMEGN